MQILKGILLFFLFSFPLYSAPPVEEYKIGTDDVLTVNVYDEADLSLTVRVSLEGKITYPLLGEVKVGGLTIREVEEKIRSLLEADYLVKPHVNANISKYSSFYIMGQVYKPGSYELIPNMTLMKAIALAGGFTKIAAQNKTRVIRVEDKKEKSIEVPVNEMSKNGDTSKDLLLKSNDVIIVPESFF